MKEPFVRALTALAREDPRLMFLTGDLGFGMVEPFVAEFPRQFLNVGVAEQNMLGIATGLALDNRTVVHLLHRQLSEPYVASSRSATTLPTTM